VARLSSIGSRGCGASCLAGCHGRGVDRDIARPVRISICRFDALHVALALRSRYTIGRLMKHLFAQWALYATEDQLWRRTAIPPA
jgi:hypothetical protein